MSFGFGVGDFLAVGTLCWKLYQNVYKVSRDAPKELQGICDELGTLSNTIRLLNDDIQDPNSMIKQPGQENRFDLAADIMKNTNNTLERLQSLADKHELLRPQGTGKSKRQYLRIKWDKLKFAKEWNAITDLRAKLLYHNNQLSLLLQVLNNSSLERLQKEEMRTQKLIEDVHMAVYGAPNIGTPVTTASFLNTKSVEELTETFLVNAQSGTRPWATIGVDSWLQAGRWWLIKAQSSLYTANSGSSTYTQAFVDLLKSSWILTNIISLHPQRKLIVSTDPRDHLIEGLARALQAEHDKLAGLSLPEPSLEQLRSADLSIWAPAKITSLMPVRDGGANSARSSWKTQDGEILLQRHVHHLSTKRAQLTLDARFSFAYQVYPESVNGRECILILEVQSQRRSVTFIAQGIDGQDIVRIPLYSEETGSDDKNVLVQLSESDPGALATEKAPYPEDVIACVNVSIFRNISRRASGSFETAFQVVDTKSKDILTIFGSGISLLTDSFVHPPINVRSLEAAAVCSCSSEKVDILRQFGSLETLPPQQSSTPTDQLCTLASQAMSYLRDGSSFGPPIFLLPNVSLFCDSNNWPYLIWLSPTAECIISLAQSTGSVERLDDSVVFDCICSAFAKGCPVFVDELLKFFKIQAQGRSGWTMDHAFNPENLDPFDSRLLFRATLQSGDRLLFQSFIEMALSSRTASAVLILGDALLETAIRKDRISFEKIMENHVVMAATKKRYFGHNPKRDMVLDKLLQKGLQDFPGQGIEWFLDLLPELHLCSRDEFKVDNPTLVDKSNFWIIPALFRQDREIVDLFLDRGLGQLHPLRVIMLESERVEKRIPPNGMPDLPLYCAIFLAFKPEFILYLCERGAPISDSASSGQPQPAIIEHLISLLTVDKARQSFKSSSQLMSNIFGQGDVYLNDDRSMHSLSRMPSLNIALDIAKKQYPWSAQTWGFMHVGELELPSPLQTQENWDQWRTEVLRILREYHTKSHSA